MKTTFTFLLLLVCTFAYGQKKFIPGYYLNFQNQKIEVYINDQNWEKNPTSIEIRKDLEYGPPQRLRAADIKGFGLSSGDVFDSYVVDVEKASTDLKEVILLNPQPVIVKDTVFLRALVKGAVSLYHLEYTKGEEHYFIQKGDEVPVELIYRTTKLVDGGRVGVTHLPIYKGMLVVKLTDCPEVANKINGVSFKKSALMGIVADYNKCLGGSDSDYQSKEEPIKVKFVLVGGPAYTYLKIKGDSDRNITQTDLNGIGYTFGVSFQATLPRNRGRYAFLAELMYKPLNVSGTYKEVNYASDDVHVTSTSNYAITYAGLNVMGRYRFLDKGIMPYINAGLGNNLIVRNKSTQTRVVSIYGSETTYQGNLSDIRKFEESFIVGLGAEWNKLQGECRFERGSGFSPHPGVKTLNHNVSLRLGYIL